MCLESRTSQGRNGPSEPAHGWGTTRPPLVEPGGTVRQLLVYTCRVRVTPGPTLTYTRQKEWRGSKRLGTRGGATRSERRSRSDQREPGETVPPDTLGLTSNGVSVGVAVGVGTRVEGWWRAQHEEAFPSARSPRNHSWSGSVSVEQDSGTGREGWVYTVRDRSLGFKGSGTKS